MTTVNDELLAHSRLVLPDRIIAQGWVAMSGGKIAEIGEGEAPECGLDMAGDLPIPGLVELHTDHIEAYFLPRPGAICHPLSAVLSYDAQIAASGITTVFDCFRVGSDERKEVIGENDVTLCDAVGQAQSGGLLRARHLTHLRCEICSEDVIEGTEAMLEPRSAELISLMDHTPGQRRFHDVDKLKKRYSRSFGMTESQMEKFMAGRLALHARYAGPHRRALVAIARRRRVRLASHDDTTNEQVAEVAADGVSIAEFPVTAEAAAASHGAGIKVLMGAPNIVRGGSHSGNVAAIDLAHVCNTADVPVVRSVWRGGRRVQ